MKENSKIFIYTSEDTLMNIIIDKNFIQSRIIIELNGEIHKKVLFKNDLKIIFSGEEIIEAFKQRIINHQNEFKQKRQALILSNPNLDMENVKFSFFTRVNNNLGFQFKIDIKSDKK